MANNIINNKKVLIKIILMKTIKNNQKFKLDNDF